MGPDGKFIYNFGRDSSVESCTEIIINEIKKGINWIKKLKNMIIKPWWILRFKHFWDFWVIISMIGDTSKDTTVGIFL